MNSRDKVLILEGDEALAFIGQRLDVIVAAALGRSRNHAQALLREGCVELQPARERAAHGSYRLKPGDRLVIRESTGEVASENEPVGEDIPLEIIYEDDALLALNKPAGLVVHPAAGHRSGTLVNALVHHRGGNLARRGGGERLGLVHRLDKDTSGLMLVAKTEEAHEKLGVAFAGRTVRKFYRALCWGVFRRASGSCREPIGRHRIHRQKMAALKTGGRTAHTDYRVLAQGNAGTEVECLLHTGRTHQIRVHLAHLGQPVWGDHLYGRRHALPDGFEPARQMLHAARLEIMHPLTGRELKLEAPLPADYTEARKHLIGG
jgi:23S rRNA pseudouridine1911/1915/1917 synthase